MNNILKIAGLMLIGMFAVSTFAETDSGESLFKEKWNVVQISATVWQIDKETRKIVLEGPGGNLMTITAGDDIQRFDEIKKGDVIAAEYISYIATDFTKPTEADEKEPLTIIADGVKAPEGIAPGVVVGAVVRAVVSIEVIDLVNMLVTIKGPRGAYVTIAVEDKKLMTELNVGQRLVVIYAETLALSLVKVE